MKSIFKLILTGVLFAIPTYAQNEAKPFVIPEIQEWKPGTGTIGLTASTSIIVPEGDKSLQEVAVLFSQDIKTMFDLDIRIKSGTPSQGDISFSVGKTSSQSDNKEAYEIKIEDSISITGNSSTGVYWATRTLLQIWEQSSERTLPKGEILDYPLYPVRGFMLDVGRKFFRLEFLQDYVKFMSYYKMNTFQIHLNDNGFHGLFDNDWNKTYSAFRLESSTYPGLAAKDGHYTKKEFIDLQKLAESRHVNIIPEIDVPAHSLAFSHYLPEIGSKDYGMDHLDLFNPKTYEFLDGLFKEYLEGDSPVFRGKVVNIGTDEYSNRDRKVVEKFRYLTDHYIKYVEKFGKQAAVWGALTHARGETPVKSENVLMNIWHNAYAQPKDMAKLGYDLLSMPDGLLYIVPEAGYYYNYLNIGHLYNNWEPRKIGGQEFEAGDPQVKGGLFAVWNDHVGNGISEKDVHHRVWPAMQTLAVKMWTGGKKALPFDEFNKKREQLSEAPGVNVMGRAKEKGVVLEKDSLNPGESTGMVEIGYDYRVEFTLKVEKNPRGTVLFQSPNAKVYLSDPKEGLLGFERDGYLFTFDYNVPVNREVRIAIEGDSRNTRLFVNNELFQNLGIYRKTMNDKGDTIAQVRTLVFPLEKTGNFKGKLTDLKVISK